MRAALARHDALLRAAILDHGGHVVKATGDAFHAAFARASDALAAALNAQRLRAEPWGEIGPLRVRMALHTGAAVFATANDDGVLGTWSFDANGDTSLTRMSGRAVVNGRFDDNAVVLQAE
jgi:class 3 adenylate cyclase